MPILAPLLPHLRQRLATSWQAFLGTRGAAAAGVGAASMEDARAADAEIIAERQLRELTQETMYMLEAIKGEGKGGKVTPIRTTRVQFRGKGYDMRDGARQITRAVI